MKGDTILDYVEFQLTPPRTRCELYVSANGITEKLASGFLKPFLTHLRAAEEQIAKGAQLIRLERPRPAKEEYGRIWFTKGTLERFVRFVSTPEVLERVKTIEDELAQLEQVRNIQASSLLAGDIFLRTDLRFSKADGETFGIQEKAGSLKQSTRYPHDNLDGGVEASKMELLRAMDVRLLALRQEQNIAFARAAAAGFDNKNMSDLMAFSEYFGAERLRMACIHFLALSEKRGETQLEISEPELLRLSSCANKTQDSPAESDSSSIPEGNSHLKTEELQDKRSCLQKGRYDISSDKTVAAVDSGSGGHALPKDQGGSEARRRWGPPENLRAKLFMSENEADLTSSEDISDEVLLNDSPSTAQSFEDTTKMKEKGRHGYLRNLEVSEGSNSEHNVFRISQVCSAEQNQSQQSCTMSANATKTPMEQIQSIHQSLVSTVRESPEVTLQPTTSGAVCNGLAESTVSTSPEVLAQSENSAATFENQIVRISDQNMQYESNFSKAVSQRLSSPKRRSSSPLRRVQVGRSAGRRTGAVVIRSINYFSSQERVAREKNSSGGDCGSSSDTEDLSFDNKITDSEPSPTSRSLPSRRLSVQDAISLFESKQRKDSTEAPPKQRPGKLESSRVSLEGTSMLSSGKVAPRRWSAVNSFEGNIRTQDNHRPEKQESQVVQSGNLTKADAISGQEELDYLSAESTVSSVISGSGGSTGQAPKSVEQSAESSSSKADPAVLEDNSKGDWRKQFKLQLERSLMSRRDTPPCTESNAKGETDEHKVSLTRNAVSLKTGPNQTLNNNQSIGHKLEKDNRSELLDTHITNTTGLVATTELTGLVNKESLEVGNVFIDFEESVPLQSGENSKACLVTQHQVITEHGAASCSEVNTTLEDSLKGDSNAENSCDILAGSKFSGNQYTGRESFGSSWGLPLDDGMQALVKMVDEQNDGDDSQSEVKGRFYEKYRKLREAKLMDEHDSKRAEREAKLKLMEETLKRRKAEMDARTARLSKNNSQGRTVKFQASKTDPDVKKDQHQEDGDKGEVMDRGMAAPHKDKKATTNNSASPPVTPKAVKEQAPFPKVQMVKKPAAPPQKTVTTPRTSHRAASSVSPKLTPKNTTGATFTHRKLATSTASDNPLTRSVPCFANLRKENTKPSPGRSSGSSRVHPKSGGSGRPRGALCEGAPLDANINTSVHSGPRNIAAKEERKKQRSTLMRKSCASASELKALSALADDGILAPLKAPKEAANESLIYNKLRRSAVAPIQEAKPFLRKGRGIGPGAGPGVMKQKTSIVTEIGKISDEEELQTGVSDKPQTSTDNYQGGENYPSSAAVTAINNNEIEITAEENSDAYKEADLSVEMDMEVEGQPSLDADVLDFTPLEDASQYDPQNKPEVAVLDSLQEDSFENERACHTISLPIDMEAKRQYATSVGTNFASNSQSFTELPFTRQEDSVDFPQPVEDASQALQDDSVMSTSTSFRASSLPHELLVPVFSPNPASPSSLGAVRPGPTSDYLSPTSAVIQESPLGSPASWKYSQVHSSGADMLPMNKKLVGPQKVGTVMAPKEPAKGFKRLLNFARKGRASEVITADYISASTASEGDDESEELGRSGDDYPRRGRQQERRTNEFGVVSSITDGFHDSGSQDQAQCVRSSIPAPPSNFKLRDDHLAGGTMLKAPRSFFSLSTFRSSKASEAKSR